MIGKPVMVCPVVLGREAEDIAQMAVDLMNDVDIQPIMTPFVRDLIRFIAPLKSAVKLLKQEESGEQYGGQSSRL